MAFGPAEPDPIFRQAREDVMKERIKRVQEEIKCEPQAISGNYIEYRPDIERLRRIFSCLAIPLVFLAAGIAWISHPLIAACVGGSAVIASVALAITLLREVLVGAGTDSQQQYYGPSGVFREYSFKAYIDSPSLIFSLAANVISGIVVGYSTVYCALGTQPWFVFSKPLDPLSSFYFSLVTFATVGYGDFYPESGFAKLLVCSEIVVALFVIAVVLATLTSWTLGRREEHALERRTAKEKKMQHVEALLKQHGVGLYQDDEQLQSEIAERVQQLRKGVPPASASTHQEHDS